MTSCDHDTHLVIQAPGAHANNKSNTESCPLQKLCLGPEARCSITKMLIHSFKPAIGLHNLLNFLIDKIIVVALGALQIVTH